MRVSTPAPMFVWHLPHMCRLLCCPSLHPTPLPALALGLSYSASQRSNESTNESMLPRTGCSVHSMCVPHSRGVVILRPAVRQRLPAALAVVRHAAHNQHVAVGQGDHACRWSVEQYQLRRKVRAPKCAELLYAAQQSAHRRRAGRPRLRAVRGAGEACARGMRHAVNSMCTQAPAPRGHVELEVLGSMHPLPPWRCTPSCAAPPSLCFPSGHRLPETLQCGGRGPSSQPPNLPASQHPNIPAPTLHAPGYQRAEAIRLEATVPVLPL